ncbi:BTB/POZ domain-containing protein At3g19850-like [Andrographis paniculata]|uniref:BTB/POZ domain-containing protein At3g19850-like n=1 Tax=Andrographis paniculata TaxID=175694 RepID=UPI0021E73755|nr:BTB/POZ domain-containing protein At3g19850-like [Andrographis paniculata]
MSDHLSDFLQIRINAYHTFFLSQTILRNYSRKLGRIIEQENQITKSGLEIGDFPGGPYGFELVSRFCYAGGRIPITVANVSLLYCSAVFLEMTEEASKVNLLHQTEVFLEGIFYWTWDEILACLKNCEPFFSSAESSGLIEKLLCSLLAKIAQKSDVNFLSNSPCSSSSSPDTGRSSSPPSVRRKSSSRKALCWWFQDLTILSPKTIEHFLKSMGAFLADNNNLVLTRFLLHYLKTALQSSGGSRGVEFAGLVDTAAHGVVSIGKAAFSCRFLFWVLRIVSSFGVGRDRKAALEQLIGGMLDHATLDDLLVPSSSSSSNGGGVYDVSLVIRLIRLFVHHNDEMSLAKMKKVGRLIDMYLGEIAPDPNLKISKLVGVAESLPDCARDSFDHVYRAIDIYLESHPGLSLEERSRLCRCLNYAKLSLEACKDLAKNPRIPPRITVQALATQHASLDSPNNDRCSSSNSPRDYQLVLYERDGDDDDDNDEGLPEGKEEMKLNLERMQWRVVELEKVCREMKGQMARMVKLAPHQHGRALPRLC